MNFLGIVFISYIGWSVCILYIALILFSIFQWRSNAQVNADESKLKPCSILIPYRNEAKNLPGLLDSLDTIPIDKSRVEILLIDDHSEDESTTFIKTRIKSNYILQQADGIGKKKAIDTGISIAKFDTIFQLDADGTFGKRWFYSLQKKLNSGIDFLTGIISIKNPQGWLEHFQLFELMALMGMTNAGIKSGYWHMANGANMAYPKKLYRQISNPAHAAHSSGDDMFLIEEARRQKLNIDFNKDRDGIVYTQPVSNLKTLIHQRLRWASKNSELNSLHLKWILFSVILFNISLIILPFIHSGYAVLWIIKLLVDLIYLLVLSKDFSTTIKWLYYPVSALFYPLFIGYIGLLHMVRYRFSWKGRLSDSQR